MGKEIRAGPHVGEVGREAPRPREMEIRVLRHYGRGRKEGRARKTTGLKLSLRLGKDTLLRSAPHPLFFGNWGA